MALSDEQRILMARENLEDAIWVLAVAGCRERDVREFVDDVIGELHEDPSLPQWEEM